MAEGTEVRSPSLLFRASGSWVEDSAFAIKCKHARTYALTRMHTCLVLGLELQAHLPPYLGKKMLFPDQSLQC